MTDPAEIRAEGRRLLALEADADSDGSRANVAGALYAHLLLHADVLLADPAPVGLTEDERALRDFVDKCAKSAGDRKPVALQPFMCERVVRLIDRLSTAPVDDRERVPEGWRVEWPLSASGRPFRPRLVPVSPSVDPEDRP